MGWSLAASRTASHRLNGMPCSISGWTTPMAARRRPNGSLAPVGASPAANSPTSESIRSASATASPGFELGSVLMLAAPQGIFAADDPLQGGHLGDHLGGEVRLGQVRSAAGKDGLIRI